jgi:phosphate-selective porin OprO/OprP
MDKKGRKKGIVFLVTALALLLPWLAEDARADEVSNLKEQLKVQTQLLQQMQGRLEQLEATQKLKEKSLRQEIEQPAQKKPEMGPTDFRVFWKEGLNFATQDGSFKLKVGGRLMNDWLWIGEDKDIKANVGEQEDGVEFRRARLDFSGLIYDNVEYRVELDFAGGDADFKDVYLGLTDFPLGSLRMGHFKEPFSLEELTSSRHITFLERALPNVFVPSRNTGVMLRGTALAASDPRMTWAVGVFRDTDDYGENVDDGGYNITGRVTALPIYQDGGAHLLHVGAAYSYRNPDDAVRYRQTPEAHLTDRFVDTGTFASDQVDLFGLEAAWVSGPLSVQSEYVSANADVASSADFDGYYVQASYFLTGEHRNYKTSEAAFDRVKPKENYSFSRSPGAWEVAARYSELDLDDGNIGGGKLKNITAGLNWYLNPNTKIMWNYVHAHKDDVGDADLFMVRLQFDF